MFGAKDLTKNEKTGEVEHISGSTLKTLLAQHRENLELIDVRENAEFQQIRIKGSRLMPMSTLMSRLHEIDWNKQVVFICRSGNRSGMMAGMVAQRHGKSVLNLRSGILECYAGDREHLEFG